MSEITPALLQQVFYAIVFLALVAITGGVIYLTVSDRRDRRRRNSSASTTPSPGKKSRSGKRS